jgi:hypothetical protein
LAIGKPENTLKLAQAQAVLVPLESWQPWPSKHCTEHSPVKGLKVEMLAQLLQDHASEALGAAVRLSDTEKLPSTQSCCACKQT